MQIPPASTGRFEHPSGVAMTVPKFYEKNPQEFAIKQSPSTDVDVGQFMKGKLTANDSFAGSGVFVLEVIFWFLPSSSLIAILSIFTNVLPLHSSFLISCLE